MMTRKSPICSSCGSPSRPGDKNCAVCGNPLYDTSMFTAETRAPVSNEMTGDTVGHPIDSRYDIIRELGQGGMGRVLLAYDRKNGWHVAIKQIFPELAEDADARARFMREVRTSSALRHENIVRVHEKESGADDSFFVMEYIEGRTLRELIHERRARQLLFTPKEAAALLLPVLSALAYAHENGVIHRDIKPENIIVGGTYPDYRVKVLDFGLARLMTATELTQSSVILGTAYYMAPEQLSGSTAITERADLFSTGVILYELLTGRIPTGRFRMPGEMVDNLPPELDDVLAKALSTRSDQRFESASAFIDELKQVIGGDRAKKKKHAAITDQSALSRKGGTAVARKINSFLPWLIGKVILIWILLIPAAAVLDVMNKVPSIVPVSLISTFVLLIIGKITIEEYDVHDTMGSLFNRCLSFVVMQFALVWLAVALIYILPLIASYGLKETNWYN